MFMRQRKLELYDIENAGKFPDVSNTRYGSFTYGAADVVCFHGLIQELVCEIIDGKAKSGQANHVEYLILKGINCAETMSHLAALALLGVSVHWGYMDIVRGKKENPINLLSLTDLHRRLPKFCANIAANPWKLLDPTTPLDELTIDAKPFRDEFLVDCIRQMKPHLPNLFLIISTIFSGAEQGWIRFTPEFQVGGTFDRLTPEQRAILVIPSTNDSNEGMLGSFRVHMRYHPNSTAHSFSNQTRTERNDTEAFIKKCCDDAVQKFVMREVRKDGKRAASKVSARMGSAATGEGGESAWKKREIGGKEEIERQSAQLAVYRDVIKDDTLTKKLWKDMATVAVRRTLVLAARDRELGRRTRNPTGDASGMSTASTGVILVEEYGYSRANDEDWEDVVE
ncbi:hypothetical protein DFH06DRAFT_1318832 [Mycena polygramma]|nr:hypothetical protein DFH06DRAFT_1318832 [Mycena polygramma]